MNDRLWVDPEGLTRLADAYRDRAAVVRAHQMRLAVVRSTYEGCGGSDDLGRRFSEKYTEIMERLNLIVGSAAQALEFASEGLDTSGKAYRRADDDAGDASAKLRAILDGGPLPQPYAIARTETQDEPPAPMMTSQMLLRADFAGANIDGVPVPDGFQLIAAKEIGDGIVRLDVNGYEVVSPLGPGRTVTDFDGKPIALEDGMQMFLVKGDPEADPQAPADPVYVDFERAGTAVPHRER